LQPRIGFIITTPRSATKLEAPVKEIVDDMPWATESLGKINQMALSGDLLKGFDLVPKIESAAFNKEKQKLQMDHLMAIARHEQGIVLQPLIYDDPAFNRWTARELIVVKLMTKILNQLHQII